MRYSKLYSGRFKKIACAVTISLMPVASALAKQDGDIDHLLDLSLEQLMNIEVTSVMKSTTHLSDTPAAIYVLTNEDIIRSGATSIPEALRMVPGMHVAKTDANKWAVSVRGFNGQLADKLLVLIDGQSVYSPLFSGVFWEEQNILMEDVDHIEVVRGPGASLWGANAVNGVISITTKSAKKSQGGLLTGYAGSERGGGSIRYGSQPSDDAYLRIFANTYVNGGQTSIDSHSYAGDVGRAGKAGFRYEKTIDVGNLVTLQGDFSDAYLGGGKQALPALISANTPASTPPYTLNIGTGHDYRQYNLLGRFEHQGTQTSKSVLQVYWQRQERNWDQLGFGADLNIFDLDFQHDLNWDDSQRLVLGLSYRLNEENAKNGRIGTFNDPRRSDNLYSLYAQDDITLVPERWKLTLGNRFEYHPIVGWDMQPNARLLWTPSQHQTFWSSVSRAVRMPSLAEQDLSIPISTISPTGGGAASPVNPVKLITIDGTRNFKSEELTAYELGWRGLVSHQLSADAAIYYYDYRNGVSISPASTDLSHISSGYVVQHTQFSNFNRGHTFGGEIALDWQAADNLRLRSSYSEFHSDVGLSVAAPANSQDPFAGSYPKHQAVLWSQYRLSPKVNLDCNIRYVGKVNTLTSVDSYTAVDARIAWAVTPDLELSLVGRNLLDGEHIEYSSTTLLFAATEVPRELFLTARYHF